MKQCSYTFQWTGLLEAMGLSDRKLAKAYGVQIINEDDSGLTIAIAAFTDDDMIEMERKQRAAAEQAAKEATAKKEQPLIVVPGRDVPGIIGRQGGITCEL